MRLMQPHIIVTHTLLCIYSIKQCQAYGSAVDARGLRNVA